MVSTAARRSFPEGWPRSCSTRPASQEPHALPITFASRAPASVWEKKVPVRVR
jgi:hypothetical protein